MKRFALLIAGAASVASCDSRREPAPQDNAENAVPAPTPSESQSILREDVANEVGTAEIPERPELVSVRFTDNGEIDEPSKASLDEWFAGLALKDGEGVTLRGHTDSRGSDDANRRASQRRAEAVRDYLVDKGMEEKKVTVIALGEDRPIAPNSKLDGSDYPEGRALNRRVDVEVTSAATAESASEDPAA